MIAETKERRKRPRIALPDCLKSVCSRLLVPVCAMVAGGFGLAALLGWVLGLPFLAGLGPEKIPMAPSTAILFVLYGVTIFLRSGPPRRVTYWTGLSVHATGTLIALLLIILSYQGIHPEVEHLGLSITLPPGLTSGGHMSPVTALCFLLASLSFLASLPASLARPWRAFAATLPACLLLAISPLLVLSYLFGTPFLYDGAVIPPALPSSLAFVALGTVLLALALPHARQSLRQAESATRFPYDLIVIFIILTMGILTSGYLFYQGYEKRCRIEVEHQLTAIADLKVGELVKWRGERLGDAEILYQNTIFSTLVSRYFNNQEDSEAERQLREWLGQYQKNREYDQVRLLDPEGVTRMSSPAGRPPASAAVLDGMARVLQTGLVTIVDLYRHDHDQRIYLSVLIPILDVSVDTRVIAVLSLRVDPEKYLYPFILHWPLPSQTVETLLFRREGDEVLFLNNLKFREKAALTHRVSLERTNAPPVMAVLGQTGIVEGLAYGGEAPVIAAVGPVPDSPWFLMVRMNISEVYASARGHLWMILGLMTALVFGAGAGLAFVWRQQSQDFYLERLAAAEALRKSEKKLSVLHRIAEIFLLVTDEEMYGQVLEVMLKVTGSQYGVFGYLDEEGAFVAPSISSDIWEQCRIPNRSIRFPRETWGDCIWVRAIMEKRSLIKNAPGRVPEGHVPVANALVVPILFRGEVIGLFELANRPDGYDQAEQYQVEELCSHIAPVLNSRLSRDREEATRKQAEEALRNSALYTRSLIEVSLDPLVTISVDGMLMDVNAASENITGVPRDKLVGSDFSKYFTEPEKALTGYRQVLSQGFVTNYPLTIRHTSGRLIDVLNNAILYRNERGDIAGIFAAVRDITELKRAEDQIRRSLAEKEVMLKEIHHRVKNNMQVIYSLLSLQADTIEDSTVRAMFEEGRNRISSMALIHEKLYQSEDLAQIDFKDYLQILVQGIADTYKRREVHLSVNMEPIALDVNVGIPCGLIVNELVTNSLKHAFPEGRKGLIRVGINKNSEGNYVLTVEDNGIGFPAEMDFRKTSSLGLKLVNVLTGQIRGTIALSRTEGTRFSITFPVTTRDRGEKNG